MAVPARFWELASGPNIIAMEANIFSTRLCKRYLYEKILYLTIAFCLLPEGELESGLEVECASD